MSARAVSTHGALFALATALATLTPFPAAAAPAGGCTFAGPTAEDPHAVPRCVAAEVTLDSLPAVGQEATARVRLRAQVDIAKARFTLRLPASLRLVSGLPAPRAVGLTHESSTEFALSTGGRTVTVRVAAVSEGPAQIEALVTDAGQPAEERSVHASALLTIGTRPGSSRAGADVTVLPATAAGAVSRGTTAAAPVPAGQICVIGSLEYTTAAGATKKVRAATVAVVGKELGTSAAVEYKTGVTGADGSYTVCFTPPRTPMAEVSAVFRSQNPYLTVNDSTTVYTTTTPVLTEVNPNTAMLYGPRMPASAQMRAWRVLDTVTDLWNFRSSTTGCWTARETANCSRMTFRWWPAYTGWPDYTPGTNATNSYVRLTDAAADTPHTVVHEGGHAFQHMLYGYWWPAMDCGASHDIFLKSGAMCAWTEGFANAVTGTVMGDNRYVYPQGGAITLMNTTRNNPAAATSTTNWDDGDHVEGRVAGTLIDLWTRVDGGQAGTINLMRQNNHSNFGQYFNARTAAGLSTTAATRDLVYTHAIDYRLDPILANGGFENGTANWAITNFVVGEYAYHRAQQGTWYAWMGGNGVANTDTLSQQITIPNTVTTANLTFYLRVVTAESGPTVYDTLNLRVTDGATTTNVAAYSNADAGAGYAQRTVNLNAWRGRTVTLQFTSIEDSEAQTDFLIDTLRIATT
ncbi:hypothetical protein [Longispora urticae]